jgi:molybdopterin-containing oxidoreductase family membrane subunit
MDIRFEAIQGRSVHFYVFMGALAVCALAGMFSTYLMYEQGIYLSGMTNRIPWGLQIVMAVFYIGLSAGSLVISGLYGVFGKLEYKPFARVAAYIAVLLMIAALLSILTDQGRIDRVLIEPFVHLNPLSMFSINPSLYIGYILICIVYLGALFTHQERLTRVTAITAVVWAIGVHSGTGAIFGFVPRELYQSPLLPPSFIAAALSSGTGLMILLIVALFRLTRRPLDNRLVVWLGRLLGVLIVGVMYFVFVENAYRFYLPGSREAARYFLFGGFHSALFWGGLVLVGSIIPAAMLFSRRTGNSVPWILFASVLTVFGVFCERYVIVIPGLTHPPELFPGMEITRSVLEEGIVTYSISFYEVLQALGVLGIIGLLFVLGLKWLSLLPTEARAPSSGAAG